MQSGSPRQDFFVDFTGEKTEIIVAEVGEVR